MKYESHNFCASSSIRCFNKRALLCPQPAFDLLLTGNCYAPAGCRFKVYQAIDIVLARKSGQEFLLVLVHTVTKIICDACIQCPSVVRLAQQGGVTYAVGEEGRGAWFSRLTWSNNSRL